MTAEYKCRPRQSILSDRPPANGRRPACAQWMGARGFVRCDGRQCRRRARGEGCFLAPQTYSPEGGPIMEGRGAQPSGPASAAKGVPLVEAGSALWSLHRRALREVRAKAGGRQVFGWMACSDDGRLAPSRFPPALNLSPPTGRPDLADIDRDAGYSPCWGLSCAPN